MRNGEDHVPSDEMTSILPILMAPIRPESVWKSQPRRETLTSVMWTTPAWGMRLSV
ncbi:unnamed protein product [Staurois parvus]|nr:unnamed protein product [Staurois parvus]